MLVLADWVQVGAGQLPAGGEHGLLKRAEGAFHPSQPEPQLGAGGRPSTIGQV